MSEETATPIDLSPPPYRELTAAAVIFGVIIGAVMTAAFAVALKLGFTLSGSTVAAILGFAVFVVRCRKGSIIENNINQTVASGVNTASAGVAFTLPALYIMGEDFSVVSVILAAVAGAFLGMVVIIPLRKQMIEFERLRFPERHRCREPVEVAWGGCPSGQAPRRRLWRVRSHPSVYWTRCLR